MRKNRSFVIAILAIASLLLIVWGVSAAWRGYNTYRLSSLTQPYPHIAVQLLAPTSGDQGLVGSPVQFAASAYGEVPLEEIIFWVDNVPVKVSPVADGTALNAQAFYAWIPAQPGSYAVFARAVGADEQSADSNLVEIEVLPGEKPAAPQALVPDPAYDGPLPGGGGDSGEAQGWSGGIGGWLFPAPDETLPDAPGLSASADGCQVVLSIADHAANETGFRIYRSIPNLPGWTLAATLAANDDLAVLTYTDAGFHGTLGYKAAAFNAQGEAASNPVSVAVDPQDCPDEPLPILKMKIADLHPLVPVDLAYCYFSLDNIHWLRWPQEGFLPMDGAGISESSLFAVLQQMEGQDLMIGQSLMMDCWGWRGGELVDLGQFQVDGLGQQPLAMIPFNNGFLEGLLGFDQMTTMDGSVPDVYSMFLSTPVPSFSDDVEVCLAKLGSGTDIPFDYCLRADGETAWPFTRSYITWEMPKNCPFAPNCYDFNSPYLINDSSLEGAQMGYQVHGFNPAGLVRTFNDPAHMVYMVPGIAGFPECRQAESVVYRVSSFIIPAGSQQVFQSPSAWFAVPEPCPSISGAIVQVTPRVLYVGNPVEEETEGQLLDLFGGIFIYTFNMRELHTLQFGAGADQIKPGCPMPDSTDEAGGSAFGGKCPIANGWGVDFDQAYICPNPGLSGCFTSFSPRSNTVELTLLEGEVLSVYLSVLDYDVNSADDTVCEGSYSLPAWTEDDWQSVVNGQDLLLMAFSDNGSCVMEFDVQQIIQFEN